MECVNTTVKHSFNNSNQSFRTNDYQIVSISHNLVKDQTQQTQHFWDIRFWEYHKVNFVLKQSFYLANGSFNSSALIVIFFVMSIVFSRLFTIVFKILRFCLPIIQMVKTDPCGLITHTNTPNTVTTFQQIQTEKSHKRDSRHWKTVSQDSQALVNSSNSQRLNKERSICSKSCMNCL